MTTPESPAPQSAGLSEREECPLCEHAWRTHDPEDGRCDAGPPCECGRSIGWMRERIATLARRALADEKGEALASSPSQTGVRETATPPSSPAGLSAEARLRARLEQCHESTFSDRQSIVVDACLLRDLLTALEATAARLVEVERQRRIDEEYEEGVNERLRATLAERERELGEVEAARVALADEREEHIRTISDLRRETEILASGAVRHVNAQAEWRRDLENDLAIANGLRENAEATLSAQGEEFGKLQDRLTHAYETIDTFAGERDALKEKLAAAERVVGAARSYMQKRYGRRHINDALAAYDAMTLAEWRHERG